MRQNIWPKAQRRSLRCRWQQPAVLWHIAARSGRRCRPAVQQRHSAARRTHSTTMSSIAHQIKPSRSTRTGKIRRRQHMSTTRAACHCQGMSYSGADAAPPSDYIPAGSVLTCARKPYLAHPEHWQPNTGEHHGTDHARYNFSSCTDAASAPGVSSAAGDSRQ